MHVPATTEEPRSPGRRKLLKAIAGVAAAAGVVGGSGWFVLRREHNLFEVRREQTLMETSVAITCLADDVDKAGIAIDNAFRRMAKETLILAELNKSGIAAAAANAEDDLSVREVRERLKCALDQLPPKQKLVYTLSRDEGWKHEEIARYLNISPSTVNNHMIAALRTIRKQLGIHLHSTTGASSLLLIIACFLR